MRIAYDAKRAAQNRTGLGNYSRFLIQGMVRFYDKNEYLLYVPNPKRDRLLGALKKEPDCLIRYPQGKVWKKFPSLWRVFGMAGQLRKDRPSIFHGLSNELPVGIEKIKGIKTIVTIHDLIFFRYPEFYKAIDRRIYTYKFRSACERADSIIAVSEATKRDIMDFFQIPEQKIKVIYQGCDESFRNTAPDEIKKVVATKYNLPDQYLLYVGSIESRKNLIRAVEALAQTRCHLPLVAVGKFTPYVHDVWKRARELGVTNRLLIVHGVEFAHLPAVYQMSSLFIYPSYFEGFGIPILEALCSQVPVIGATGSCLEEAGGPGSIYINPDRADELAAAIDQLLGENEWQHTQRIRQGLEYTSNFQPGHLAGQIQDHYDSLVSNDER